MLMTVIGVITATRAEGVRQQEVSHFSSSILSCYSTPDDEAPQKKKKKQQLFVSHPAASDGSYTANPLILVIGKYCALIF